MYRFNIYSWILVIVYFTVFTTMEYFSYKVSIETLYFTLPLISVLIFWSEKTTWVIKKPECSITKIEEFKRDLFLISFSFFSGYMLSLLFECNNSDTRGWWPIIIYFITAMGIVFAFIFSLIAAMLNSHKNYTLIFACTLIVSLLFFSFMVYINLLSIFAKSEIFYLILLLIMGVHLLLCLFYKKFYAKSNEIIN